MPEVLKTFPKLYSLSICKNEIEVIPDNYFESLLGLETLMLDNNKLKKLPSSIADMKRLKKFSHENNPLEQRPEWLSMVRALI